MSDIAFLGTGIMGAPMARHLAEAGHDVKAWNRTPDKAEPLRSAGVVIAESPRAAVATADAVILMVSTGTVADELLFGGADRGGAGIASHLKPGATVVVMSSIPVETSRQQAERLAPMGVGYVDAPVSGGEKGAIGKTLTIMAGGAAADIEKVRVVLEAMGKVTHVGPAGCGQLTKLANQTIVGITIGAVAEAFLLAREGGADLAAVYQALTGGFADSTILRQHGQRMIEGNYKPGAQADIQLKDLRTSRGLAESIGMLLPILKLVESLYADMCEGPWAKLDHSALILEIEQRMRQPAKDA